MLELAPQVPQDFGRIRPEIDAALDRYTHFDAGCPDHLSEAIRYALLAPGKRLRPQLVVLAAEACGAATTAALPAACSVEMVHAYSLVHDDLPAMDDDDLRRGRATCHKVFGEDVAILVGDALLARAFEILATEISPTDRAARCCAILGRAAGACNLVGGQAADLAGQFSVSEVDQLISIHRRKTGALFVAALQLGGIVGGAKDNQLTSLTNFGQQLGLAFQIVDDLLDVSGDQATVGKKVRKDADHGKVTYPKLLGSEESRRRAADAIQQACDSLMTFGDAAEPLRGLARFVLHRNR